ncbi:DUF4238 domain-containing protein [Sphingomonas gellani]|uniref:DUF4238 domain-containing protein n=1 Tax=Sphingomonas gellani TaxID=1166340 RepID=UPI00147E948D|nr:DUF4238 domain-containing protein [Sphingomonas gellani]
MAGRKQHYIPQFLLRSFAEPASGDKLQIRVFTRGKSFVVPTDGIAAQREFYSKLSDDSVTLDDRITYAKSEYADLFRKLVKHDAGDVDSSDVARLLTHLSVRGNHIRSTAAAANAYALSRVTELLSDVSYVKRMMGFGLTEPPVRIKKVLDDEYNKRQQHLGRVRVSRHGFRRFMFTQMNERWDELFSSGLDMKSVAGLTDIAGIAREAHNEVLLHDFEPTQRVSALEVLDWQIKVGTTPTFVLTDAIALAHDPSRGAMPAMFTGLDDIQGVLFPLSPTRAVCAGVYADDAVLEALTCNFRNFAASASWEFVIAPPSYGAEAVNGELIGSCVGSLIFEKIEEAVAESLAEPFYK